MHLPPRTDEVTRTPPLGGVFFEVGIVLSRSGMRAAYCSKVTKLLAHWSGCFHFALGIPGKYLRRMRSSSPVLFKLSIALLIRGNHEAYCG